MASVYDLDELVQLVALHLGDYGNLGRTYMSAMDQPTILCITYVHILAPGTKSVGSIIVKGFLRKWLSG